MEDRITYFAETDYRNSRTKFGIKAADRTRHMYVIGKTGMGKSTLLENMAIQDIQNGEGMAFIDPHGGTAEKLLDYVPKDRIKDVVYFAPFDMEYPVSFNVMEDIGPDKRHLVASGLMSSFKKIWVDAWSARMEYILNNILLALLEYPNSTLLGVNRMLADKDYRKKVVENISDPSVKSFWVDEFAKYGDRYMQEAGAAIQNKIGQFTANPIIRNIIGQPKSTFDIRKVMDEKKILIMNLSKGRVGEQNASLLGGMLITKIYLGAMSRADVSADTLKALPHFYFYVDEFQSFANKTFADILSEARKYKLNLTIAHQYIEQMEEEVRAAVFGNVGTMVIFRVGATDAELFEKEFSPVFLKEDIVNLGYTQIYLRLMINGIGSKPFSALTLPPIQPSEPPHKEEIIEFSRTQNARSRQSVEEEIKLWHAPVVIERPKRDDYEKSDSPRPQTTFDKNTRPREFDRREPPRPPVVQAQHRDIQPKPQVTLQPKVETTRPLARPQNSQPVKPSHPPIETKKPFQGLKNILQQLEADDNSMSPVVSAPTSVVASKTPLHTASVPPVSLASLKKPVFSTKEPSLEHRTALKNALQGALKDIPIQTPKPPPPRIIEKEPEQDIQKRKVLFSNNLNITKTPREVPEEILKKILE